MNTATDTSSTGATGAAQTSTSATEQTGAASTAAQTTGSETSTTGTAATSAETGGQQTTATTDAPWQDGLDGDLKTNPLFRGYKTVSDLAKAHDHLTKLKGVPANELLRIPAKTQDQAPDDWAAIHKALGVPDDPKDYNIQLAPEAAADAPALEATLRELGGKAKLQPAQMATVIETLNTLGKQAAEAEAAQVATDAKAADETLRKEWGAAYEGNKRAIGKLIRDASGGQIDEAALAELEGSLGSNVTLARVLAHAIGKMAEPEAPEGGANAPGGGSRQLTPAAATAALNAFYADAEKTKALNDRGHPQHKAVLEERKHLLAMQRGEKRPDQAG